MYMYIDNPTVVNFFQKYSVNLITSFPDLKAKATKFDLVVK